MNYVAVTAGEQLAYFVDQSVLSENPWPRVADALLYTGRSDSLCEWFREIAVINLTCRLVVAGTSLLKETPSRVARSIHDVSFEQEFRNFIRERLLVPPPLSNTLFRFAMRAVERAQEHPSSSDRAALKRYAQRQHPHCYMCGRDLDFTEKDKDRRFTLEHLWPRRYGGDSTEENWLPACGACNSRKKKHFASWAMVGVQAVILGFAPSEDEFTMIDGTHRFAMHYLEAKRLAIQRNITLKAAFLRLRPWEPPYLIDEHDLGDFFNLANHQSTDRT